METEKLLNVIREILLDRRQVAIPGFGGFVLVYQPSAIEEEQHRITGPSHTVSFNPSLNQDDGVFKKALGESFSISPENQQQVITDFVKKLDKQLSQEGNLKFPGIGTVKIEESGSMVFEPERQKQNLPSDYGLPEVVEVGKRPAKPPKSKPASATTRKATKPSTSVGRGKRIWWIGVPAAVVVIVIAGYLQGWFTSEPDATPAQVAEAETGEQRQQPVAETEDLRGEQAEEPPATSEEKPAGKAIREAVAGTDAGNFYLIAGSFKKQDNALQLLQKLGNKNYPTEIHRASNGYYRVSIGSYQTKKAALSALKKEKTRLHDVWVWERD